MSAPQEQAQEANPDLLDHAPPGAMCLGCRYDIGGMDIRAKCPECGDRIAPSVNFISLEHADVTILQALDDGTRRAKHAGLTAISGLALLCAGYTLGNKGLPSGTALFGTLLGSALLLLSTALAARASLTLFRARLTGEEQKTRMLRKALPVCALVSVAIALLSAVLFMLAANGKVLLGQHGGLSWFFVLWIAFPFVPIYTIMYLQVLAARSKSLNAKLFMALGLAGFFAMMFMPTIFGPAATELLALFGIRQARLSPIALILPIDVAYVWPFAIGLNIILALVAIASFRKGMGFTPTAADQPHEPHRS